ncbi:MAG: type III-B CRISPR-associated protein Cas10/Cmr2 [Thermoguttaceae bacterium]|nr:type III-B CRISPR-associated protein Cas10/Cmr2 [Thermoguttaceae bacterium]
MKRVLTISLGPVQGFIATARKTRDLWGGSYILSSLSKAAAKALVEESSVEVIFPGLDSPSRLDEESFSVANVIVCVFDDDNGDSPNVLVEKAKGAVRDRWEQLVAKARDKAKEKIGSDFLTFVRRDFWEEQTRFDDLVEFCAAWTPLDENDVGRSISRAAKLLAGRKNCREFSQPNYDGTGVPKSSLDGARESVLSKELVQGDSERCDRARDRLMIRKGEQLDAIGLIKRLLYKGSYRSLMEIAIQPRLKQEGLFDDSIVKNMVEEALEKADFLSDLTNLNGDESLFKLSKLAKKIDEEGLYVALLLADGDKMGATLSSLKTIDARREFSIALSKFSGGVKNLVEKCDGELVYAGGDDVMAFLPVDQAVGCANELRLWFETSMIKYPETSLSVGIAIVHYREALDESLDFARSAEKVAKSPNRIKLRDDPRYGDRNGLAIGLTTRGNVAKFIRERWEPRARNGAETSSELPSLAERLRDWGDAFAAGLLPSRFPYELYELAASNVYAKKQWRDDETLTQALRADAKGVATRKEGLDLTQGIGLKIDARLREVSDPADLERFANEMVVAKKIADYRDSESKENK